MQALSNASLQVGKFGKSIASPGCGILAMDESNATCGKRLAAIGLENTEANCQAYRTLLVTAPDLGQYISAAILFEETLYQSTTDGRKIVEVLVQQNIIKWIMIDYNKVWFPWLVQITSRGAKVLKALPLAQLLIINRELVLQNGGLSLVSPNGSSALAVKEASLGLARYAAISQDNGLVPIVEPEILLDGDHGIDNPLKWRRKCGLRSSSTLLRTMSCLKATPKQVAEYTLRLLHQRIPPAVPGIMFLSGGQSEVKATLNLNAMNQAPNPWHVSFSYARALQNICLKKWGGRQQNVKEAQEALLVRAKANSPAQLGKYTGEGESEEAKKGMFVEGYVY
ncbi:fructose-bisphosphate aldolase 1, chloroplastic isoform X1 [Fagus crenata]